MAAIVFPVRYVADGSASQTTARALSLEGIEVRTLAPPPPGTRLSMALYLPGGGQPEVAIGRVAESQTSDAGEAGFRADFLVLDDEARLRIGRLLAGRASEELRSFQRHPVRLQVRLGTGNAIVRSTAINLSRSGLFVCVRSPPALMDAVQVQLELPDGGGPISSACIVVHRQTAGDGRGEPGAGVQFVDASDAFRERIDRFLESLPQQAE